MDASTIVIFVLPLLFLFLVLRFISHPTLPYPSILSYLPGGTLFSLFWNPHDLSYVHQVLNSRYGPLFFSRLGPIGVISTAYPQDVVHLLSRSSDFGRPEKVSIPIDTLAAGSLFSTSGIKHDKLKRNFRSGFNPSMLEAFTPKIHFAIVELLDSLRTDSRDFVFLEEYVSVAVNRIITNVALGVILDRSERLQLLSLVEDTMKELSSDVVLYPIRQWLAILGCRNRLIKLSNKLRATVLDMVHGRIAESSKSRPGHDRDMLDVILDVAQDDLDVAVSLSLEIMLAGSFSTLHTAIWAIIKICSDPSVHRKVVREVDVVLGSKGPSDVAKVEDVEQLKYLKKVWKETLRLHPITSSILRVALHDVILKGSGMRIRKGQFVQALIGAVNTDEDIWERPTEFNPERMESVEKGRSTSLFHPFGAGSFICIGKFLADFEGPLIVAQLFRSFDIELACDPTTIKAKTYVANASRQVIGNKDGMVPFKVKPRRT